MHIAEVFKLLHYPVEEIGEVEHLFIYLIYVGTYLRHIQNVVHKPGEPVGFIYYYLQVLVALFGIVARYLLYHGGVRLYHGERRAQVVRNVGEQFLLEAVGLFYLCAGIVERIRKLRYLLILRRSKLYVVVPLCHLVGRSREALQRIGNLLCHAVCNEEGDEYCKHAHHYHIALHGAHCVVGDIKRIAHDDIVIGGRRGGKWRAGGVSKHAALGKNSHVAVAAVHLFVYRFAHAQPILALAVAQPLGDGQYHLAVGSEHGNIHIVFYRLLNDIFVHLPVGDHGAHIHGLVQSVAHRKAHGAYLLLHEAEEGIIDYYIANHAYEQNEEYSKKAKVLPKGHIQASQPLQHLFFRLQIYTPALSM